MLFSTLVVEKGLKKKNKIITKIRRYRSAAVNRKMKFPHKNLCSAQNFYRFFIRLQNPLNLKVKVFFIPYLTFERKRAKAVSNESEKLFSVFSLVLKILTATSSTQSSP